MENERINPEDLVKYEGSYSEEAFWSKLKKVALSAGSKAVYYALLLFYTLTDPATPTKYKAIIAGALGYFILPIDLIPDFLPFSGMADDWIALAAAVMYVFRAITPENRQKALDRMRTWFPGAEEPEIRQK